MRQNLALAVDTAAALIVGAFVGRLTLPAGFCSTSLLIGAS